MAKFKNPIKSVLSEVAFKTVYSFLGEFTRFWGIQTVFGKVFGNSHFTKSGVVEVKMKKKNFKGRCEKRTFGKCKEVCKTYNPIQAAYAEILQKDITIEKFSCNVPLDDLEIGDYTSDFVCTRTNGEIIVRECVFRRLLQKPKTLTLLDASREYWQSRGISDWGLVIDAE